MKTEYFADNDDGSVSCSRCGRDPCLWFRHGENVFLESSSTHKSLASEPLSHRTTIKLNTCNYFVLETGLEFKHGG